MRGGAAVHRLENEHCSKGKKRKENNENKDKNFCVIAS